MCCKIKQQKKAWGVLKPFTKGNKFIVRLKLKLGIYGISFYAPLFLSVPIGTIITAKFYGKEKKSLKARKQGI